MKGISPGDRVDVMVFLKRNGADIPETGAFTILKNVRVFAVNTNTERANDARGESANFKTISLLVKPEHARELAVASAMGKIMLTLRRPDEKDEAAGEEVTPLNEILSGRSKLASEPAPSSAPKTGSGFMGFVQSAMSTEPPAGAPITDAPPAWKMELMSPSERKVFEWRTDKNQFPTEAVAGGHNFTSATNAQSNSASAAVGAGSSEGKTTNTKNDDSSSAQTDAKTNKDGK